MIYLHRLHPRWWLMIPLFWSSPLWQIAAKKQLSKNTKPDNVYKVTTPANGEPVTLQEVKNFLRVEHDVDNELILDMMRAARENAEHDTGLALLTQTIEQYADTWPCSRVIFLEVSPLSELTSVEYLDGDGTYQTFSSDNYTLDDISKPGRIVLNVDAAWPSHGDYPNAIRITYSAGTGIGQDVLATVRQAIKMQVAYMYQNREDAPMVGNHIRSSQWLLRKSRVAHI